jgi:hypothetical protein
MSARRQTALHEAGHAVADVVFGIPIEYVSIRSGHGFGGIEVPVPREFADIAGFDLVPLVMQPPALRADVERCIIATLAGGVAALHLGSEPAPAGYDDDEAERIATQALGALGPRISELVIDNETNDKQFESDQDHATDLAIALFGDVLGGAHYLAWLRVEAETLVVRYRAAILRVADMLERHAVLAGDQIAALVYPPKEVPVSILKRKAKAPPIAAYVARETGVTTLGGRDVVFTAGVTRLRPGHALLKAVPSMFEPSTDRAGPIVEPRTLPAYVEPLDRFGPRVLGPIPPERRVRAKRQLVVAGTFIQAWSIWDSRHPIVEHNPADFEPAPPDPEAA